MSAAVFEATWKHLSVRLIMHDIPLLSNRLLENTLNNIGVSYKNASLILVGSDDCGVDEVCTVMMMTCNTTHSHLF